MKLQQCTNVFLQNDFHMVQSYVIFTAAANFPLQFYFQTRITSFLPCIYCSLYDIQVHTLLTSSANNFVIHEIFENHMVQILNKSNLSLQLIISPD